MPDETSDPYTRGLAIRKPPQTLGARLRYLGPGVIVSGSIVGSGEIILTSSLGAAAGFALFWWVLFSCWIKSLIQAELSRYIVVSGDTYLRAINRIPGKVWGPRGKVSWTIWLGLLAFIPGVIGVSGILGGAAQALNLLIPALDATWSTVIVGIAVALILGSGGYRGLEKIMVVLVMSFTAATLTCAIAMQWTPFSVTAQDIGAGLSFDFPMEYLVLALAVYGYTGVNSGETSAYTYWCIEKGYPAFIGDRREDDADWLTRARGWVGVLHMDVWLTLIILTCATIPFYLLGAGVLNTLELQPDGLETIAVLSEMFTRTLGPWALWLFSVGAFFILFSTTLAAIGGGGRFVPDYLIELGFFNREELHLRLNLIRIYVIVVPLLSVISYLFVQNPVTLVSVGAITGALFLPLQSGATLFLQHRYLPKDIRPPVAITFAVATIFVVQVFLAALVIG
ncbi:MAG: Nramp family divalent metal transporter, partial [Gammaproteobacteria bacterium]|nr:Nramp family divalent metal transporter [Gammaproteobacteria bacterium]